MSLKAGGVGLNLTAASNVFIMVTVNICWNIGYMHASGQALEFSLSEFTGSMVESCSGGASNHANPPYWAETKSLC